MQRAGGIHGRGRRKAIRRVLFERQGGRCHWCDCVLAPYRVRPGAVVPDDVETIDHLVPLAHCRDHPERNNLANLVLACARCNRARPLQPVPTGGPHHADDR